MNLDNCERIARQLAGAACVALLATAAAAQAVDRAAVRDLDGGPAYKTYIFDGLVMRLQAFESARRSMLLMRCSALDRDFPARPAPRMVAVADAAWNWAARGGVAGVGDYTVPAQAMRIAPVLIAAAFSADELAAWDRFRLSARGRRAIAITSLDSAILKTTESLVDVNTGRDWHWPLANLRRMADELALRPQLDEALEQLLPGAAAAFARLSPIPGEEPVGSQLAERLAADGEALEQAFIARLAPAEKAALAELDTLAVYRRWPEIWQALTEFVWSGTPGAPARLGTARQTAADLCKRAGLRPCEPAGVVAQAVESYRGDMLAYTLEGRFDQSVQAIVKRMPEAGCP